VEEQEKTPSVDVETPTLPKWNCRVDGTPKDQQWTVGEIFYLICEGPTTRFSSTNITFKEEEKSGFELRALEVTKQTDNALEMRATTYVAKPHEFKELKILDSGKEVALVEPFTLPVKSVITQPDQKPYGPMGPVALAYPMWLWVVLGAVVVLGVFFGLFRMNRRAQMRRVIEELKQHNTALGAFNQFNKDLRVLGRQYIFSDTKGWSDQKKSQYIENLDEIVRMYLLREFYVPALEWNSNLVVKTISKQDKKRFSRYGQDLQKFLKEMDRAKKDGEKVQTHDCKQLTQMAKRVTQSIWKVRRVSS
jgi:hypothetical protein